MLIPFYLKLGYTTLQIGTVVKLFGFVALVTGGLVGGALTRQIGTYRALMWFGILQAVATAAYAWLVHTGISLAWLAAVVSGENLTLAMSTAALLGFLAQLTDRRFTATQFALLTSLVGVSRVVLSAPAGYVADFLGWSWFFIACGFMAVPGLLLLTRFRDWIDADQ
jgi:MFS transporter, PAT family, beta-lactamase induction signal transducer AmpG